jgi:glycosyltransferase involved in cell wall biosynthesis
MATIGVIVLSYNRPHMLRQALDSVWAAAPNAIVLADDGSDFDAAAVADEDEIRFVGGTKRSAQERRLEPSVGALLNTALQMLDTDVVAYLCDDDIMDREWLDYVGFAATAHPEEHAWRGEWRRFHHGHAPALDDPLCSLDARGLTTGNFAHRLACYRDEGLRWDETVVVSQDDLFTKHLLRLHPTIRNVGRAGWRREHAYNMLGYVDPRQPHALRPDVERIFDLGSLEE